MRKKFGIAVVVALLAAPVAVHAQGVIGGMQRGAAEGSYAAGPVGGVVGGAVGGAVDGVNGALGGPRYEFSFRLLPSRVPSPLLPPSPVPLLTGPERKRRAPFPHAGGRRRSHFK